LSTANDRRKALKKLLDQGRTLVVPGSYDALSAKLVQQAGYELAYVGSYATSAAGFGVPDVGVLTMTELAAHAKSVVDAVDIPVLADAENGFFNAANIWRTVHAFEDAGVCGIHIEDHEGGKHTDLPQKVLPLDQMIQKIKAAMDARRDPDFLIIARTDAAWAMNDCEESVRRLKAFAEAGADLVLPTGLTPTQLGEVRSQISSKVMMVNTPSFSVADEEAAGIDIVVYYGFCLFAATHGIKNALKQFKRSGSADKTSEFLEDAAAFEEMMDYKAFSDRAKKYGVV
jgi:2-methylisocitrate lyase-like PEP mutase family enzyme